MNVLKALWPVLAVNLVFGMPSFAATGPGSGGGGGAYVRRDASGAITRAMLVDLWETDLLPSQRVEYKQEPAAEVQLQEALSRLQLLHPNFGLKVEKAWKAMPFEFKGDDEIQLDPPTDVNATVKPSGSKLEGMMQYDGNLRAVIVRRTVFSALQTPTEVAAAYMHEAIYKVLRDEHGDTDSRRARKLTGCLFSSNMLGCLNLRPQARPIELPAGKEVWQCSTPYQSSFYLVLNHRNYSVPDRPDGSWDVILERHFGREVPFASGLGFRIAYGEYSGQVSRAEFPIPGDGPLSKLGASGFGFPGIDFKAYPNALTSQGMSCRKIQTETSQPVKVIPPKIRVGSYVNSWLIEQNKSFCDVRYDGFDAKTGLMNFTWIDDGWRRCPIVKKRISFRQIFVSDDGQTQFWQGIDARTGHFNGYELSQLAGDADFKGGFLLTAPDDPRQAPFSAQARTVGPTPFNRK